MVERNTEIPAGWEHLTHPSSLAQLRYASTLLSELNNSERVGEQLRKEGTPPERVCAILTQLDLRAHAATKFGAIAADMLFTRAGLEQATRGPVAAAHAKRFITANCQKVADLGCGLGAESLAFAAAGLNVTAVEIDPLTAAFAEHNLSVACTPSGNNSEHNTPSAPLVLLGDAEQIGPGDADGVFCDPARRTAGHTNTRRVSSHDYAPSLNFAYELAAHRSTGIKLGPGFHREAIPHHAEAQWVSVNGQLVETGLWFGGTARQGIRRAALIFNTDGSSAELTAGSDATDAPTLPLGEYIYEPDGAVIRARLIGLLASQLHAGMLSDGIAYLTAERLVSTPFAHAFRVVERLPVREKELRQALAQRDIGQLEIKKRGVNVDPAALRTRMRLRGERAATLFMTRENGHHVAFIAERCQRTQEPQ